MKKVFSFGVPVEGDLFTDREEETKRLVANFNYGINTFILSPRKWGKTSLVHKAIGLSERAGKKIVYLDVLHCKTREEFCSAFASAILKQTAGKVDELMLMGKEFLSHLFLGVELSPDPSNPFNVKLDWRDDDGPIESILSLPERIAEKKKIDIVVCIDEFQQIATYKDSLSFQALLRGIWQLQKHTSYCLFGSKKHAMEGLFDSSSKPFYKFGDILYLKKIPISYWIPFITDKFRSEGKEISEEYCKKICEVVSCNSSYVQQLSWYIFQMTDSKVDESIFLSAVDELVSQCSEVFEARTQDLPSSHVRFLRALSDGVTSGFSSSGIISKYKLGTSANVAAIKASLLAKGLIDTEGSDLVLSDPVMGIWLRKSY